MPIIKSILDTDLYKLTMQQAIRRRYPKVKARYVFSNRRKEGKFTDLFMDRLQAEIDSMADLRLTDSEEQFLSLACDFFEPDYIDFLRNYVYHPQEVSAKIVNGDLVMDISGLWQDTILWEVPLMAIISELYFLHCDTDWTMDWGFQVKQIQEKIMALASEGCEFSDFGTRRRRNYDTQNIVAYQLKNSHYPGVLGTSNVHFAHKYNLRPIGTQAHEWFMGISVLEGLRHANRYGLKIWHEIYKGKLGIALPDTFGSDAFFRDFDYELASIFDGVRHDSADPFEFGEKLIKHYQGLNIDPLTKRLVPSDGLNTETAIALQKHFRPSIKISYGIGTHLTNDFPGSKPLNMVIKLSECDGVPVVKLSDVPTKAIGDPEALRVARWTFFNKPLDAN
jgi:nicotinate phosphoribosyltransferase